MKLLIIAIAALATMSSALAQTTIYPRVDGSYAVNGPSGTTMIYPRVNGSYGVVGQPAVPSQPNLGPYGIGGAQSNYGSSGGFGSRPYSTGGR